METVLLAGAGGATGREVLARLIGSCVTIFGKPADFGRLGGRNERVATARRQRITHDPMTATDHRVRALTRSDANVDRLERAGADDVVVGDLLVAALHTPDAADRTLEVVWNPLLADRATTGGADVDWQHPERKP